MMAWADNPAAAGRFVTIYADDSGGRRSRASQIGARKRVYEAEHQVTLALLSKSYDEMHGFLARSAFRYEIIRPCPCCQRARDTSLVLCAECTMARCGGSPFATVELPYPYCAATDSSPLA